MEKTSNEGTSQVSFKSNRLKIDTLLSVNDMSTIYSIDVLDSPNDNDNDDDDFASRIGTSFDFDTFCIDFKMGASVDFEKLMISEGMAISFINDKTSLLSSSSSSSFFKSNIVDGTWTNDHDLEVDLGNVDVTISIAGLLRVQLCYDVMKQTVDKSLAVMKYIKSKYKSKSDNDFTVALHDNDDDSDPIENANPITLVKMATLKV